MALQLSALVNAREVHWVSNIHLKIALKEIGYSFSWVTVEGEEDSVLHTTHRSSVKANEIQHLKNDYFRDPSPPSIYNQFSDLIFFSSSKCKPHTTLFPWSSPTSVFYQCEYQSSNTQRDMHSTLTGRKPKKFLERVIVFLSHTQREKENMAKAASI